MLKYQKYTKNIPNCPPSECKPANMEAFRFVFGDIDHRNNFLPALLIKPARRLSKDSDRCSGYALSFFNTLEKAKSRYFELRKKHKNIGKNLGSHIAKGFINKTDSIVTEINKIGHFDFA